MGSRIHSLSGSQNALYAQVRAIEDTVGVDTPIPPLLRKQLFDRLDNISRSVEKIQRKGGSVNGVQFQSQSDFDIPDRIQRLYGTIHDRSVDTEIHQVVDQAFQLQQKLEKGKDIVKDVSKLKRNLARIERRHALGLENRSIAKVVSRRADQFLRAHALGQSVPPLINQFNLLEVQRMHYRAEETDEELVVGLFEIAESFYRGNYNKETMKRYHLLPEEARRTIREHFEHLSISSPKDDRVKAAQALIATAYDLAHGKGTEPYFSGKDLEKLFNEANASEMT